MVSQCDSKWLDGSEAHAVITGHHHTGMMETMKVGLVQFIIISIGAHICVAHPLPFHLALD